MQLLDILHMDFAGIRIYIYIFVLKKKRINSLEELYLRDILE